MTHEEFQNKVQSVSNSDLIGMADKALSKLCSTGGRSFTMNVPPRVDDTDIVFSELIRRFKKEVKDANN